VAYGAAARNGLKGLEPGMRKRVVAKIEQYAHNPQSLANNVSAMTGDWAGLLRLRVGRARIIFVLWDESMKVLDIGLRGKIY
jgi:mRNA interferase RelE/StbE